MKKLIAGMVIGFVLGAAIQIVAAPDIRRDPDGNAKADILSAAQAAHLKAFLSDARVDQVTSLAEWRTYQKTMLSIYRKHLKLSLSQLNTE